MIRFRKMIAVFLVFGLILPHVAIAQERAPVPPYRSPVPELNVETGITPLVEGKGSSRINRAKVGYALAEVFNNDPLLGLALVSMAVTLKGNSRQCLLVDLATEAGIVGGFGSPAIVFWVLINGVLAHPGPIIWQAPFFGLYTALAFDWWLCGLAARGQKYNVQVFFAPHEDGDGNTASVRTRKLQLLYGK
jgi:hypothetical protein